MTAKQPSRWRKLRVEWEAEQTRLFNRLRIEPLPELPRYVAGADAAFSPDKRSIFAAAVIYDRIEKTVIEISHVHEKVSVPYMPGFLSFREGPAVRRAIEKLKHEFGVICFDGQGLAHPRRCGLATHLSILLDKPGIGVAKSRLIGTFNPPPSEVGATSPLMDRGEQIGLVVSTRKRSRPLFVSIGHRVDLNSARELVLACCTRYRMPEPTRQADIEVGLLKRNTLAS